MTNLTILEAFRQTLSATKKYVNNRIDGLASETYVNNAVAGLVDSAPEALNTLNELASALGNDANFATTISNQIGLKANSADLATVATSGSYNDLSDKPTIPTKVSQLQNDSDFATETFVTTKIEEAQLNGGSGSVAKSYVTYEEFGAKCDSVYDDGIAIKLAHEYANQNNLTVKPDSTKTYYIKQAHSIPIINDTDLNNATFIIDDTVEVDRKKNVFEVKSKKEPITIVDLNFTVNRTTVKLSNLSGHGLCLVQVINANKKQFIREGSNSNEGTNQQDYFVIDNEGSVLTDIIWDFEQITSCTLYPFDDTTLTMKNAKFITRSNGKELQTNYFDRGLNVNRSNVILENISHRVENEQPGSPYHGFISGKYCAYLTLKNCSVQSRKAYKASGTSVWMGSYDIETNCVVGVKLENVIDVTFDNKERWGAFASNFCKDIVVENSTLSRVDAHQGARNITIRNSVIGNQGLRIIGSGLCLIEDSKILNSTSLITLRSDYGSSWEGVLVIRRTYWKPDATYAYPRIINFANASNHEFGYTCYFPRLIIDDLEVDDIELSSNGSYSNIPIINNNTASFGTDITSFTHPYHFTDNIECKNMRTKSDKGFILFNSSTINLYNKNPFTYKVLESTSVNNKKLLIVPNTKIVLDNVKLAKVSRRMNASGNLFAILNASGNDGDGFTNNANHVLPLIHIKNCENVYAFTSNHPMILKLEDSVVSTLLNVGASTRMNGKATRCLFKPSIDGIYQSVNTNYGDFAFTDCKFDTPLVNSVEEKNPSNLTRIYSFLNSFDSSQNKYSLIDVKMDNCNIYDGSRNMDLSNYVTISEMTDAINNASLGGSGGGTNNINDEVISTTTTYSSNKIETSFLQKNSELDGRQLKEASVNMIALNTSETMSKYDVAAIIWEVGNISSNAGTLLVRENRIRTKDFIEIVNKEEIELLNTVSNSYNILLYDYSTEAFIKSIEGGFGKKKYISDGHYKMKIVIKNDDDTVINVNTFVASEVISISKPIDLTDFVDYNRFEGISKKTDFPIVNVKYEKVELPQAVNQDCCVVGNEIWMWRDREGYVAINGDDFTKIRERGGDWVHGNAIDYIDNVMLLCDTTNPYFFIYHNIKDKDSINHPDDPDRVQVNLTKTATDGSTVTFAPVEGSGCFGENKYIMYYLDYDKSDMDRNMVLHKILLGYGDNDLSDTSAEKNNLTNFGKFKSGCDENTFNGTFKVLKSFTGNLSGRDNRPQGMTYDGKIYVVGGFEELRCNVIEIDEKTNRYYITHRLKYNTVDYKNNYIEHESQAVFIHKNELYVGAKNFAYFFKTHIY